MEKTKLQYYVFDSFDKTKITEKVYEDIVTFVNDYESLISDKLNNVKRYGKTAGLYYIWKNSGADYIGFSFDNCIPNVSKEELADYVKGDVQIAEAPMVVLNSSNREEYKDNYYDYDICVLRRYFIDKEPVLFDLSEKLLEQYGHIAPSLIMRKDVFRKFCAWLFPILEFCNNAIAEKRSTEQNKSLEHLTIFLLTIFITNFRKKYKTIEIEAWEKLPTNEMKEEQTASEEGKESLTERAQALVNCGKIEAAEVLVKESPEGKEKEALNKVFENYLRQRRHFRTTDLDLNGDLAQLIAKYSVPKPLIGKKPKMLIMVWDSVNNDDYVSALANLGFEYETLNTVGAQKRSKEYMDKFSNFLDEHDYDIVFSINYFDYIGEACYTHNIPYISWSYDSPSNLGNLKFLKYDTSQLFLFDSAEVNRYRQQGFKNVHYLPLAVNIDYYDNLKCTASDLEKYKAQVSFVGRLYKTKLQEYLNYLSDYKKGFFNALIDFNVGLYDTYAVEDIFSRGIAKWLDEKPFRNAVFKGESKDVKLPLVDDDMEESIIPRIGLLTNMTITNRERLLLISILSNHWKFKLYSDDKNELFKNVEFGGLVNYYTEMPKVFKCSDINLNITFKSIKTGVPLRCLDIMGCGGFLLTNYQKDLEDHFKDGENIAIFKSLDEAYEKCEYYLLHEDERFKVAQKGHDTVKKYYTYRDQLIKAFKTAKLDYMLKSLGIE